MPKSNRQPQPCHLWGIRFESNPPVGVVVSGSTVSAAFDTAAMTARHCGITTADSIAIDRIGRLGSVGLEERLNTWTDRCQRDGVLMPSVDAEG